MRGLLRFTVACSILLLCLFVSINTYEVQASNVQEELGGQVPEEEIKSIATHESVEGTPSEEPLLEEPALEESPLEEPPLYEQIVETATKLKGVNYKYAGTSPTTGFDCSGFTTYVFAQYGISLPRSSSDMYALGVEVKRSELRAGDLVFFKTSGNKISHVGIYIGDNQFIHSSTKQGVIITNLNDPYYWSKRYVGAKRII